MTQEIDELRNELAASGVNHEQVQWVGEQESWHEGMLICSRDGDRLVVRQLGRGERDDHVEIFDSEAAAADALRRRFVAVSARPTTPAEQRVIRVRMQRRNEEINKRLRQGDNER